MHMKMTDDNHIHLALSQENLSTKSLLTLYVPETKIEEFANSADPNEVAHYEPPHLDLLCLPPSL